MAFSTFDVNCLSYFRAWMGYEVCSAIVVVVTVTTTLFFPVFQIPDSKLKALYVLKLYWHAILNNQTNPNQHVFLMDWTVSLTNLRVHVQLVKKYSAWNQNWSLGLRHNIWIEPFFAPRVNELSAVRVLLNYIFLFTLHPWFKESKINLSIFSSFYIHNVENRK